MLELHVETDAAAHENVFKGERRRFGGGSVTEFAYWCWVLSNLAFILAFRPGGNLSPGCKSYLAW